MGSQTREARLCSLGQGQAWWSGEQARLGAFWTPALRPVKDALNILRANFISRAMSLT